ncbi:hypothetical protein MTBSS4_490008 [Magnetospirillum sp. SS-4]|nr:hypothetical protein MTBSS4_490008 [Magnetospirillum sp. SS-4]
MESPLPRRKSVARLWPKQLTLCCHIFWHRHSWNPNGRNTMRHHTYIPERQILSINESRCQGGKP